jgi:hypothetical protein
MDHQVFSALGQMCDLDDRSRGDDCELIGESMVNSNHGWLDWDQIPCANDRISWRTSVESELARTRKDEWSILRRGDSDNLEKTFDLLGEWVVAKPRWNYPWWHANHIRSFIVWSKFDYSRKLLLSELEKQDLLLERLNVATVDDSDRTGEIRSFAFARHLG